MERATLRNNLDKVFQEIQDRTGEAELPQLDTVNEFVRLCRLLHSGADEDWAGEAEDFAHMAQKLLQAVKRKDKNDAVMIVESMADARTYNDEMFEG
jgi:XXXCH domain-containing protein